MVSFLAVKREIKNDVLKALSKAGKADKNKLIAELSLNTGFVEGTINKILSQMNELGYIRIDGDIIYSANANATEDKTE